MAKSPVAGIGSRAGVADRNRITPLRARIIRRAAAPAVAIWLMTAVRTGAAHASGDASASIPPWTSPMPIRLNEMSTRPARSTTRVRCASTAAGSSASTSAASAAPPAASISAASRATGASVRPDRKSRAPSRAKALATAVPTAPPAP